MTEVRTASGPARQPLLVEPLRRVDVVSIGIELGTLLPRVARGHPHPPAVAGLVRSSLPVLLGEEGIEGLDVCLDGRRHHRIAARLAKVLPASAGAIPF